MFSSSWCSHTLSPTCVASSKHSFSPFSALRLRGWFPAAIKPNKKCLCKDSANNSLHTWTFMVIFINFGVEHQCDTIPCDNRLPARLPPRMCVEANISEIYTQIKSREIWILFRDFPQQICSGRVFTACLRFLGTEHNPFPFSYQWFVVVYFGNSCPLFCEMYFLCPPRKRVGLYLFVPET